MSLEVGEDVWIQRAKSAFAARNRSQEVAAALSAEAGIKMVLCTLGLELAASHSHDEALSLRPQFVAAMRAAGANEDTIRKNWARVLYKYAFPGVGACDGDYWLRAADGVGVIRDKSRKSEVKSRRRSTQIALPVFEEPVAPVEIHKEIDAETVAAQMARALEGPQKLRALVCGPAGSGKTSLAVEIVRFLMVDDSDLRVVIISGSSNEADFEHLTDLGAAFQDWDEGESLRRAVETKKASPDSNQLIILDDVAIAAARDKVLEDIFVNGRHYGCSVILLSQQANNLASPIVKGNLNFFIFGGLNGDQIELVRKSIGLPNEILPKKDFAAWAYNNTGAPDHGFGVHIVTLKKESPIFLLKSERRVEKPKPADTYRLGGGGGAAAGPAAAGGGLPRLAAVVEVSNSQETALMSPGMLPSEDYASLLAENASLQVELFKIKGLLKSLYSEKAADSEKALEAEVELRKIAESV